MSSPTVVIGSDEHATRALLSVLPAPREAQVVQLGALQRDALLGLPVAAVAHYPDVDVQGLAASDLADLVERHAPASGLVVLDSAQWSRDVAGYLAHRRGAAVVWAVDRVAERDGGAIAEHVVLGGSHRLVHRLAPDDGLTVVLAKPVGAVEQRAPSVPALTVQPLPPVRSLVRELARTPHRRHGLPLAQARIVVCIGRGIGDAEHVPLFERLAAHLGGALAATRVVVDRGWLPFAHQVGQTGETVAPDLYLGFGVSGAAQHLAGIRASRHIVAINTDPDAPLCRLADVVVAGDAVEVATRLLATDARLQPATSLSSIT